MHRQQLCAQPSPPNHHCIGMQQAHTHIEGGCCERLQRQIGMVRITGTGPLVLHMPRRGACAHGTFLLSSVATGGIARRTGRASDAPATHALLMPPSGVVDFSVRGPLFLFFSRSAHARGPQCMLTCCLTSTLACTCTSPKCRGIPARLHHCAIVFRGVSCCFFHVSSKPVCMMFL